MVFSSSKGVLYMADDALFVYKASGRSLFLKEMYDWNNDELPSSLLRLIKSSFSSVVVVNDTVDQHYRKEKVPKVGVMDATSVVKRRLSMAFPEYPIRTSREVPRDKTEENGSATLRQYLFCACPDNGNIRTVLNAIRDSGVGFQGVALLPMEAEGMIEKLSASLSKKKSGFMSAKPKASQDDGWTLFVGQNASGGLRQIVIRNGMLALTRISPIVETDVDMQLWCSEVKREVDSTLGYLSRFGYKDGDRINVIVVGGEGAQELFDGGASVIEGAEIDVVSANEAAKILGLSQNKKQTQHMADGLYAGWVARRSRLANPRRSAGIDAIVKPRTTASAVAALLVLGLVGSMYFFSQSVLSYNASLRNLEVVDKQKQQLAVVYKKEVERKEALGIDINLIQSSFDIHDDLKSKEIAPLEIFESIARAMEGAIKLDRVLIERADVAKDPYGNPLIPSEGGAAPSISTLQFSFPGGVDVEKGNAAVVAFSDRIKSRIDGADVKVTKILKDVSYTGGLETEIGVDRQPVAQDNLEAEIVIKLGGAS